MKGSNDYIDFEDDFEDWEGDAYFYEKEDWVGLLKLRKERYELDPDDHYSQYRLGQALIFNKKYDEAIEFLTPVYKEDPEFDDVIHLILDALYEQGKNENDFKWISIPTILRLDDKTKDLCFQLLKNKRKRISVTDLYIQLLIPGAYLKFDESEFAEYLRKDIGFDFEGDETSFWDCKVKIAKSNNK